MARGRRLEAYERAVNDLLDALASAGNPRISKEQQMAAHRWAVEASLAARYAALSVPKEAIDRRQ
jgi:intein-encoded DNA endonuclease-like protein